MEIVRFAILGLATGAILGLFSQGLVLIYRGSGLLNFAHGAIAMTGAYAYYDLVVMHGWPKMLAAVVAILICGLTGGVVQLAILRRMREASALSRVIVTLGVLLVLQSVAYLRYGHNTLAVPSLLPTDSASLFSSRLTIPQDRLYIIGLCVVCSIGLSLAYRYTRFGRITAAMAENEAAAAALGYSPNLVGALNWTVGSMLAGLAGVLISPIIFLEPTALVLLVIPAMSAALIGGFTSFPLTLAASLGLGVAQAELTRYVDQPGWGYAAPFIAIIVVLVARGRTIPLRSFVLDRLPAVGSGRVRWPIVVPLVLAIVWITLGYASTDWAAAIATTASMSVVCLSVVVLTGFGGQLSLAQFVLAGVGALLAAHLAAHTNFFLALALSAVITGVLGAAIGLPALRTRGTTLAVVTLGLGGTVVAVVLTNPEYNGGAGGLLVPPISVFGWRADPLLQTNRYALIVVAVTCGVTVAVANLRRGTTGRLMLATRSNERAAASLGVNVAWIKTYAFFVAGVVAAVGGILYAFLQPSITVTNFDVLTSILIVAATVTGGVGNIPGAFIGSLMIAGGITSQLLSSLSSEVSDYLPLVGGIALILNLAVSPDGLFEMNRRQLSKVFGPFVSRLRRGGDPPNNSRVVLSERSAAVHTTPRGLSVAGLSVSYGGVHAVEDVSITVRPGEVHGLIGPNGAGKTSLIDAITGFAPTTAGKVMLGDASIGGWSVRRRAQAGLSRSFQSLELFTDLTIAENLAVAAGAPHWTRYLSDFVYPGTIALGPAASLALRGLELDGLVDRTPQEVSFGQRKTVAIARAIASAPSVLLLDEPAAGLDDHEADELAVLIRRIADDWGIGVLLVEHKVDLIMAVSDRVTVLHGGRVLASGVPDDIRSNPDVVNAYLGSAHVANQVRPEPARSL